MAPVPNLNWPTDLFAQAADQAFKRIPSTMGKMKLDDACVCAKPHNHNVSYTRRSLVTEHGGWIVSYFCSERCKGNAMRNTPS